MADKSITELDQATEMLQTDLFVLSQNGIAKKLEGITLKNYLADWLDGHGGISSIAKTGTSGLVDTYTIYYAGSDTTSTYTVTNGAKGDTAPWYVWVRYADAQPTRDADMKTTPSAWIGIYSGVSSTAPATYTSYTWYKFKGEPWYVHIRYSTNEPTQDSDMHTSPDNWMGIYSGTSSTAPTNYLSYGWFKIKGTSAYVHIMYAQQNPTSDYDMTTVPSPWIGIYSGESETPPTSYTAYSWYQFRGTSITGVTQDTQKQLVIAFSDGTSYTTSPMKGDDAPTVVAIDGPDFPAHGANNKYTMRMSNNTAFDFYIYSGEDGTGAGDMMKSVYDINNLQQDVYAYTATYVTNNAAPISHTHTISQITDYAPVVAIEDQAADIASLSLDYSDILGHVANGRFPVVIVSDKEYIYALNNSNIIYFVCMNQASGTVDYITVNSSDTIGSGSATYLTAATAAATYQTKRITFTNTSVAANAWTQQATPTYAEFPYRAAITLSGCTAAMYPDVTLAVDDANSGEYAPVAESYSGGIYLYARSARTAAITIPTIVLWS